MSIKAMTWAWDLVGLDQSATLVLLALADAANDVGVAWPSQAEIARKARLKERAVRRQLNVLRDLGLISWEVRSTSTGRRSNLYLVHVGAEPNFVSAGQNQPVAETGWVNEAASTPVDNLHFHRSEPTGHRDRLATQPVVGDRCQPVVGDRLHIDESNPHLEPPDLTGPFVEDLQTNGPRLSLVGSGGVDSSEEGASASRGGHREAAPLAANGAELIAECLPPSMRALDAAGARQVLNLLSERVSAGWRPHEIQALMGELPSTVYRLSSLVAKRLKTNVEPSLAPAVLAAEAERRRTERLARLRDRDSEAPEPESIDPEHAALWAQVRAEMPDALNSSISREVLRRHAALSRPQASGS